MTLVLLDRASTQVRELRPSQTCAPATVVSNSTATAFSLPDRPGPGRTLAWREHGSSRTWEVTPKRTEEQVWLDASAVEMGDFLKHIESDVPEEELRAWLASFEE